MCCRNLTLLLSSLVVVVVVVVVEEVVGVVIILSSLFFFFSCFLFVCFRTMVAVRCSSKYLLIIGVIINVLFIGLTQVLYISRYFKKSSRSSTSFSSSSTNKSTEIEKSRYMFIDNRDVADLGPIFKIDIKNVSGTPMRPSIKQDHIKEIIESSLKKPARTKEQMRKINELKEKIAEEINFNPNFQGRHKNGNPVEIPISPEKFCRPSSTALTLARRLLVIMVTSHVKDVRVRKEIRQTWADVPEVNSGQVRVVHLLGTITENGGTTQSLIEHEAEDYDDIVQGAFKETYKNLTTKTLMGLQWASNQCGSSFKYFMKTDSDVYVNLPKLAEHLAGLKNWEKPHAFGRKWVNVKPIRSPLHKW